MRDPYLAFMPYPDVPVANAPDGPLTGLRFGVKDLFDVAGYPTGCGNPVKLAMSAPARRSAPAVEALLAAGAVFAGKTQTDELAWSMVGLNPYFGGTVNPRAPDRIAGGSSCGSAAAVAGGLVDIALGTDTGGSVRAPAAFCGIWGLRPTWDRIPLDGCMPLAPGFDTCGIFARSGADLLRTAEVLLGDDLAVLGGDTPALAIDMMARLLPAAAAGLGPAAARLSEGETGVYVEAPEIFHDCFDTLQSREVVRSQGPWIEGDAPPLSPMVRARYDRARAVGEVEGVTAAETRERLTAALLARLGGRAALAPAVHGAPPRRDSGQAELTAFAAEARVLLSVAGVCRLPQVVFPVAISADGPLALSLIGPPGTDLALIRMASRLSERLAPSGENVEAMG